MAPLHYHHKAGPIPQWVPCTSDHQNYPGGYPWRDCKCRNIVDCIVGLWNQGKLSANVARDMLEAVLQDNKDDPYALHWFRLADEAALQLALKK